jgi:PAS domain S-box-containing protein
MLGMRRIVLLAAIMAGVALLVGSVAIGVLYATAIEQQRQRLQDTVATQARLVDAMLRFDHLYSTYPEGPFAGTLEQFVAAHTAPAPEHQTATGLLMLFQGANGGFNIWFSQDRLATLGQGGVTEPSPMAEPMRRAVAGETGTLIGPDEAGRRIIIAYAPVEKLNLGIMATADLKLIRSPFVRAAGIVGAAALLMIALGTAAFLFVGEPWTRRLRESETRFRELFENMRSGVAVFAAVDDGADFVFKDLNRSGEAIARLGREMVTGRRLTEVFPGAEGFGLPEVMTRVWRSGQTESVPARFYEDQRLQGWRECDVYKVPSGEVVVLFTDVTQQEQARHDLSESEERFRGTFENAAVGMAHVGTDGAWLRVNQRLCDILGYDREDLLRKTFQDLTHPDDLAADMDLLDRLTRGEIASFQIDKRYFHRDGHVVWITLTTSLQRDPEGQPLYCICIIEDITTRRQTAQALRDSEIRLRTLLDASPDDILLLSTSGAILAINKAARQRLTGADSETGGKDTPIGRQLEEAMPRDLAYRHLAVARRVAATTAFAHYEQSVGESWFEFWYYPVVREGGRISEVALFARDVTERKKAEADLRKLYQAIQQSPVSVVITDPEGRIEYVNPKFTEVSGYSLAEAIGENPRILKSGDTPSEAYDQLWQTISAGRIWRGEFHNRRKSGELFWELASIAPVKDASGRITHFVAVKEDITERRDAEESLRRAQQLQAIGQLTGGIAHDFNNLLAIIIGNLQLLRERIDGGEKLQELMDDALWSAQRGAELTHRLLAFARRQPLQPDVIDLNAVIRGMTDLLRRTLGATIEIREDLAADLWPAFVDRSELERALINLAVNARDAMRSGGILTLQTRNAVLGADDVQPFQDLEPGDYAVLAVSDTGEGMAPEVIKRAFDPFFTTKGVGKGSGLGLSMVYGFAKQSGGHAGLESAVGRGTVARLYLPRAQPAAARGGAEAAAAVSEDLKGRTILVVEDETRLRKLAVTMLQQLGADVHEAEDGAAALRILDRGPPMDVLFTDIELPGDLNGAQLADLVLRRRPQTAIVLTTGYAKDIIDDDSSFEDDVPMLFKPYRRSDLSRAIIRALAIAEMPQRGAG